MLVSEICCKRCKKVKPLSEFDRSFFEKKGFDVYCHNCRIEWDKINNVVDKKRCRQCGREKSISEFGKNASTRYGYFKECFDCQEENHRRKRARKNERIWDGKMIVCRRCGFQKPTYEFSKCRYREGKYILCYSCINEIVRIKLLRYEQERERYGWPIEKRCKGCGQVLPSDHFNLDRRNRDALSGKCNKCVNEWHNQWMEKVKERLRKIKIKKNMYKECSICHELKPYFCFSKDKSTTDGYHHQCTICVNKIRKDNVLIWARQREEKKVVLKEIKCRICGRILPIEMFSKDRERKKGYYNYCKDCHKLREQEAEERWAQERKKALFDFSLNAIVEKKCKICGQILPLSMFWIRRASKDGYNHYCKACESIKNKARNIRLKERGFPEELLPEKKWCGGCNRILPSSRFSRDATASDGLNGRCKDCYKEYYKKYYSRPEVKLRKQDYKRHPEIMERNRLRKKNITSDLM